MFSVCLLIYTYNLTAVVVTLLECPGTARTMIGMCRRRQLGAERLLRLKQ